MSRIGNKAIAIPAGVTLTINGQTVSVKGPKGELSKTFEPVISFEQKDNVLNVKRANEEKHTKQLHGTTRALINGMVEGVSKGFTKELEIKGIGYKAEMKGKDLKLTVGFSHPVIIKALPNTAIAVDKDQVNITITGCDKQAVGQVAAVIHKTKEPEPYLGKGIAYKGEHIRRKEGKKAGK